VILTRSIWIRLVALGLVTAILEVSFFAGLRVLGSSPDGAILVVMSLGLVGGSLSGAVAGFGIGFAIDCLLLQTLGATSLSLMAVGYVAGRYREGFGRPTLGATVLLGGVLTLLGVVSFAAIQVGLGVDADVSTIVIRDAFITTIIGAALAPPVLWLVRRLLRPALIEDGAGGGGQRRAPRVAPPGTGAELEI
jgi:rod shape-determining protein MreD